MQRVSPKAVAISTLVMMALDTAGGVLLLFLLGGVNFQEGMTSEQMDEAIRSVTDGDAFLVASMIYGTATTVFGGYLAARLAQRYPYFNAAALGALGLTLGLLMGGPAPWWFTAMGFVLTLPAAIVGGHLAKLQAVAGHLPKR